MKSPLKPNGAIVLIVATIAIVDIIANVAIIGWVL